MSLEAGAQLGVYEIVELIGVGGFVTRSLPAESERRQ